MRRRNAAGTLGSTDPGTDPPVVVDPSFPLVSAAHADRLVELQQPNMHLAYGANGSGQLNAYRFGRGGGSVNDQPAADATIATVMGELRARYYRETMIAGSTLQRARINALFASTGAKVKFACGFGMTIPSIASIVTEANYYGPSKIDSLTGPNETDKGAPSGYQDALLNAQIDLWNALHTTYRIGSPPFAQASRYSDAKFAGAPLSAYCDYADAHPYPGASTPEVGMDSFTTGARKLAGSSKPIEYSETGYHNATASTDSHLPLPEAQAGIYYPRSLLEAYRRGALRWAPYELVDEYPDAGRTNAQRWFGLYRYDWSAKPAALAVGRTMRLHEDVGGAYTPAKLPVIIDNPVGDLLWVPFGKRDGSYLIDLWRTVSIWTGAVAGGSAKAVTPVNVTVKFPSPMKVTRHLPSSPAAANASSFVSVAAGVTTGLTHTFSVGADVNVLQIVPAA